MSDPFNPTDIDRFQFDDVQLDEQQWTASLRYRFDDSHRFEEKIHFPPPEQPLTPQQRMALHHALRLLHLFAGISYYKAAIPPHIAVSGGLDGETAALVETLYRHGLGEFAYRNGIRLHDRLQMPSGPTKTAPRATALNPAGGPLIPVGGGKDSVVSIEILKQGNAPVTLFSVGEAEPIRRTAETAGLPWLRVRRQLDPALFELNRRGAYNGHVPITAIVSMLAVCTAIIHSHGAVVFSNERSASAGNLTLTDGFVVNHQYSKGLAFEKALAKYIANHVATDLDYFSLLRPWSELAIARQFARHEQYHPVFTSCNANFKIRPDAPPQRWCLDCPKCRFVFLALAPFLEKKKMVDIFGANLLDDEKQLAGFSALLGIDDHKPFECVGEEAECAAAFVLLNEQSDWRDDAVVTWFRNQVLPHIDDATTLPEKYLDAGGEHHIPERYLELADAAFRT